MPFFLKCSKLRRFLFRRFRQWSERFSKITKLRYMDLMQQVSAYIGLTLILLLEQMKTKIFLAICKRTKSKTL